MTMVCLGWPGELDGSGVFPEGAGRSGSGHGNVQSGGRVNVPCKGIELHQNHA